MNKDPNFVVLHLIVDEIVLNRILAHPKDVNYYKEFGYKLLKNGDDPQIGYPYKGK